MFCTNCGNENAGNMKFCTTCGSPLTFSNDEQVSAPADGIADRGTKKDLVGYSERINDPAFAKFKRNTTLVTFIWGGGLALIAIIGFFIYGERSYEMSNPEALYIGFKIGGMFLAIALIATLFRVFDKNYDAVVIDKMIEDKKRRVDRDDDYYIERYTLYTVVFKTDKGKEEKRSSENNALDYNYFNIGDKVRHHKGLNGWEKYDKSQDKVIPCIACGSYNEIEDETCYRCYCPLLK